MYILLPNNSIQRTTLKLSGGLIQFERKSNEKLLYVRYPYKGKFTVNSRYLSVQDESTGDYNEHRVYVVSENKGALSEGFLEGGSIKCQLRIYQDFHVYKN